METLQSNKTIPWDEKKRRLKQIFPSITDDDLHFNDGKEKVMIDRLAYKLNKSVDELRWIIHSI